MIYARSETVREKPAFRNDYKKKRCVIPVIGYYDWKKVDSEKFLYYISPPESFLVFAGIWEFWINKENGEIIDNATLIKQEADSALIKLIRRCLYFFSR